MLPVAAQQGSIHNTIKTEKSEFAQFSKAIGRSSKRIFIPNTLGQYRETAKRAAKKLRQELRRQRKHGK